MMKRLLAVLLLLVPGSAFAQPLVSDAELTSNMAQAHVHLVLTGQPQFHIFYLASPNRIVIDMTTVDWQAAHAPKAAGLVTALRHGLLPSGGSRLVLDLTGPARVSSARYSTATGKDQQRLTIEVQAVSNANFQQAIAQEQPRRSTNTAPQQASQPTMAQVDQPQADQVAAFETSAGKAAAKPAATATIGKAVPAVAEAPAANPKQAYREPLLTSLDLAEIDKAQQTNRDSKLSVTNSDGMFITYMHPPGSLLGAGVTVGTSF